jgi:large subunit ribosomal protein L4
LNKKLKRLARLSALSYKAQNQQIVVVEDLQMTAPKTSEFATMLKALNVNGRSLFVTADMDKNVFLSGRNIMGNVVMTAGNINTYEVMKASHLILTESSIAKIQETHAK